MQRSQRIRNRCKTHLCYPKNSLEELSGMSSYQELLQEELLGPRKIRKNRKIATFRDEFFSGSSDFKDEIWSEMESLGVLDVFCTDSECATTSRSNLRKKSIFGDFWIFDLWVLVIRPSKFRPPGRISADWYYFRENMIISLSHLKCCS